MDPRQIFSVLLVAGGSILSTCVAGSYAWMYFEQRKLLHEFKTHSPPGQILTKISIPRIRLEAVVVEGTSRRALLLGPGHMPGSALPGEMGNAVIAGHRDTYFHHIHSLHEGDDIYVIQSGRRFHYVVKFRKVVAANNLSVLKASKDSELTLITCHPAYVIGPAPRRLIVVAKLARP